MVFETIALSIIALLLLILMFTRKPGTIRMLLGLLTTAASIAAAVCFYLMSQAMVQLPFSPYIPVAVYGLMACCGVITAISIHKKQKKEKDARRALKKAKKAEKKVTQPEETD